MNFAAWPWPLILLISFSVIAFIQLFYYIFFFSRLAFYKPKRKESFQSHPVSVIVCARDEAENLAHNLPGILVQEYKSTHEVLVVNDNSYDDSKYLLEALQKEYKQLKVIELSQEAKGIHGKKFPLSIGLKSAKNEIALLTDADCLPATEHWIQSMQDAYGPETEIVLGYGAYSKKSGFLNKLIRWETYHTALQYMSYALAGMPYMGVGRNLSYRKTLFYRHKGFSTHGNVPGGDDDLFINKAATSNNTAINVDKNSFTLSKPAATWQQWRKQKTRHYTTGKFYKGKHKFLLGLYAFTQFLYYPFLIAAILLSNWEIVAGIAAAKLIWQLIVAYKTTKKLGEEDLFPLAIFFDVYMFFYYLRFAPALIKKPRREWK